MPRTLEEARKRVHDPLWEKMSVKIKPHPSYYVVRDWPPGCGPAAAMKQTPRHSIVEVKVHSSKESYGVEQGKNSVHMFQSRLKPELKKMLHKDYSDLTFATGGTVAEHTPKRIKKEQELLIIISDDDISIESDNSEDLEEPTSLYPVHELEKPERLDSVPTPTPIPRMSSEP